MFVSNRLQFVSNRLLFVSSNQHVSNRLNMCIEMTLICNETTYTEMTAYHTDTRKLLGMLSCFEHLCQLSWIFWEFFWYRPCSRSHVWVTKSPRYNWKHLKYKGWFFYTFGRNLFGTVGMFVWLNQHSSTFSIVFFILRS